MTSRCMESVIVVYLTTLLRSDLGVHRTRIELVKQSRKSVWRKLRVRSYACLQSIFQVLGRDSKRIAWLLLECDWEIGEDGVEEVLNVSEEAAQHLRSLALPGCWYPVSTPS